MLDSRELDVWFHLVRYFSNRGRSLAHCHLRKSNIVLCDLLLGKTMATLISTAERTVPGHDLPR